MNQKPKQKLKRDLRIGRDISQACEETFTSYVTSFPELSGYTRHLKHWAFAVFLCGQILQILALYTHLENNQI